MYLFGPIFDNSVLFVDIDSILQCTSRLACFHFGRRARNLAARQSCTRMLCSHGGRLNARNDRLGPVSSAQAEVAVYAV
jgi:hypothetical protein